MVRGQRAYLARMPGLGPRLTSHPKDSDFLQYSVPITILGR